MHPGVVAQLEVDRRDHTALIVEGRRPRCLERTPSDRRHVIAALVVETDRHAQLRRGDGGDHRRRQLLRELAAEGTTDAADADVDLVLADAERGGDGLLGLLRRLGAAHEDELAVLGGRRHARVRLHVKVLLAADVEAAAQHALPLRRRRRRLRRPPPLQHCPPRGTLRLRRLRRRRQRAQRQHHPFLPSRRRDAPPTARQSGRRRRPAAPPPRRAAPPPCTTAWRAWRRGGRGQGVGDDEGDVRADARHGVADREEVGGGGLGRVRHLSRGKSARVMTATTPGAARVAEKSTALRTPEATVVITKAPQSSLAARTPSKRVLRFPRRTAVST